MDNTGADHIEDALRDWARGVYPQEAAVELLIRSGWTARPAFVDHAIVDGEPGGYPSLDWETLGHALDGGRGNEVLAACGGELRVLRLAHSLAAGELGAAVCGLDRDTLALVLAALSHANGSHEHAAVTPHLGRATTDPDPVRRVVFTRPGPLHPWPDSPHR